MSNVRFGTPDSEFYPMSDARRLSTGPQPWRSNGSRDFDFLLGAWIVHHKRLSRMANSANWERFRGLSNVMSILDGGGTVDENFFEIPGGACRAVTVRCFDSSSGAWAVWVLDGCRPLAREQPLIGRFRDGLGVFFGDAEFEGRPIRIRFVWSDITASSARGQQALSVDAGATWQPQWTMEYERARSVPSAQRVIGASAQQ